MTGCKSGDLIIVGALAGVAAYDAAAGDPVEVDDRRRVGIDEGRGQSSKARRYGGTLDDGNVVNATGAGAFPIGMAVKAAGSNDATCRVRLDGVAAAAVPGG